MRGLASLAVAVLVAGAATPAAAETAALFVSGQSRDAVRASAEAALRDAEVSLVATPSADAAAIAGCAATSPDCSLVLGEVAADFSIALDVSIGRNAAGATQVVVGGYLFGPDGARRGAERRLCERCQVAQLAAHTRDVVATLVRDERLRAAPRTFLEVHSTPRGATVYVDGRAAGLSGQALRVAPGAHRIEVRKRGYTTVEHEVDIPANHTQRIEVRLSIPGGGGDLHPAWAWGTLGGGAALTIAGVALIAIDGPRIAYSDRQPEQYETMGTGVVLTAAGVVAATTGAILLWQSAPARRDLFSVAPTVGGDSVGLAIGGTF